MIFGQAKKINTSFHIEAFHSAFRFCWNEDYTFSGEQHDFWEIVYVTSGVVESTEDDRIYQLQEGDLILHAPMEFHKIRSAERTTPHLRILTFAVSGQLPENLKDGIFHLNEEEDRAFLAAFADAFQYYNNDDSPSIYGCLGGLALSLFLLRLSAEHDVVKQYSHSRKAKEYHNVVIAMQKHLYDNITLTDLSDQCHISISHMKRLFLRYSGISPKAYYINMRTNEALRLLQSGLTVSEVAEKMNFSSSNYFSLFMKKQLGFPPATYMRMHQKSER